VKKNSGRKKVAGGREGLMKKKRAGKNGGNSSKLSGNQFFIRLRFLRNELA